MRIAWFSAFTASGMLQSEIFSWELLPYFKEAGIEVDIFVDDETLENSLAIEELPYETFHFHKLWAKHNKEPYSLFIYLLEDSAQSAFVQIAQKIIPGVSVFFDLNLNELYLSKYAHSSSGKDINKEMDELFGASAPKVGDWYARKWSIEVFDQLYKRGKMEQVQSALSFVFNDYAKERIESKAVVEKLSFPISKTRELSLSLEQDLRMFLGLSKDKPCIGFTGTRVLEDRVPQVLEAIRIFRARFSHDVQFVWFNEEGELEKAKNILQRYAPTDLDLSFVGYQDQQGLRDVISLLDLIILPRFDPERAWPLELFYSLAAGKPCIIANSTEYSDIPDEICAKLDLGRTESEQIALTLNELLINHNFRYQLSLNAKEFAQGQFDPEKIFLDFKEVLEKNLLKVASLSNQTILEYKNEKENILGRLVDDLSSSPLAEKAITDFHWRGL